MKKYLTFQIYEWFCKRCYTTVMLVDDKPKCECNWRNSTICYPLEDGTLELSYAAAPWEQKLV